MLSPDYIANAPTPIIELLEELEDDILKEIAFRISKHEAITPATLYQYDTLAELGTTQATLEKMVAKQLRVTQDKAVELIRKASEETYRHDSELFASGGKELTPYFKNGKVLNLAHMVEFQTLGEFEDLHKSMGFVGISGDFQPLKSVYQKTLDKIAFQGATGLMSEGQAVRNAVKSLARSGIRTVEFSSGVTRTIDGHIRTVLRTSLGQLSNRISEQNIFDTGTCYVEVSAHMGARPSHSDWQGKVYYWSEMDRTGEGNKHDYPDFIENTEYGTGRGLGGWNCRHSFYPFFPEISERAYNDAELEELANEKVKYNGKELYYYEAVQKQRYLEREIRRNKRELAMFTELNDDEMIVRNKVRLDRLYYDYRDFENQTSIRRKSDRLFTP